IDLDETLTDQAINDKKDNKSELAKDEFDDEDLKLNLDELDIDIDEIESTELIPKDDPATKMDEPIEKQTDSDDLIIDIDNLDIDLDETLTDQAINDKKNNKNELAKDEFDDEDIKLNLDELDIDIDEIDNNEPVIDEDNERLSLDDAGLTFDELAPEAESDGINELSDDEIHLTLEDIDPDLTLEEIMEVAETDGELALNSLEEFPEVYANEHDATIQTKNRKKSPANLYMDELITDNSDYDIDDYDESEQYNKRSTSFSIDFSLKYSRIQACLRLLFLYFISMIPHFIVLIIYSALSIILGFINQLVVLSTGRCVGDFALIIENTMRYILYIKTNLIGIVEDRPIYAGRKYIDHPLQFDVVFPSRYSKKMAILRLSIVGIVLISLPHIILLTILSLTMPICYLIGILSVIITSQLPNILFKYLTRYFRYIAHVGSFMSGLTDDYPSFRL
ncbi:MAG: DUF4389 domain-containing protein, partial [Spirochaetes bacterium]|nr:DUF4389 domain-containing protein [Spirochaetota bacterium]